MSSLSSNALGFIPLADLLIQLQNLINQLQPRLLSSDMNSSSDQATSTPKSFPSTFPSYRVFKRYQRAKLWRSQKDSTKQPTTIPNSTSVRPSLQFFKYLQDVKSGKVKIDHAPDISNNANVGFIQSASLSPISEKLGVTDSVNSRVISSPLTSYSPRNPPIPRLPSVPTSFSHTIIVLDKIPIPAWPSHYSKVFKLFHSSSFNEKGCVFSKPKIPTFTIADKISNQDITLKVTDYFDYSRFHCILEFCKTYLRCCGFCGLTSCERYCGLTSCDSVCSDCPSSYHAHYYCPKFLIWLHDPSEPYHLAWVQIVTKWILSHPPPAFKD